MSWEKLFYNFHKATNDNLSAFFFYAPSKSGRMPYQQGEEVREKTDDSEDQEMQAWLQILLKFQGPFVISLEHFENYYSKY